MARFKLIAKSTIRAVVEVEARDADEAEQMAVGNDLDWIETPFSDGFEVISVEEVG